MVNGMSSQKVLTWLVFVFFFLGEVQFLQLDSHFIDFSSSCISKFEPNILSSSKKPIIWDGGRPLMLSPYGTCTKKLKENKYICLPQVLQH
jgi:hypothetical protein